MSAPARTLFVTTALPYANGPFHIGHIMEYIQADIWVRFQRMQGHEVHFVCADDTHGAPIMLRAEKEGISAGVVDLRRADEVHGRSLGEFEVDEDRRIVDLDPAGVTGDLHPTIARIPRHAWRDRERRLDDPPVLV